MSTVCFVFRPRRRVGGKLRIAANYSGKLRMPWETGNPSVIALGTTERRLAEQILNEKARERHLE